MRGPEDMGFDVLTLRGIWDRLIKYAFEHGTSLGATADCAGISKSAVYKAIRLFPLDGPSTNVFLYRYERN